METIYKYTTHVADELVIDVPKGAQFLHVGAHGTTHLDFWFMVDPQAAPVGRYFQVRGTGHPTRHVGRYAGTVVADVRHVWHVFEEV